MIRSPFLKERLSGDRRDDERGSQDGDTRLEGELLEEALEDHLVDFAEVVPGGPHPASLDEEEQGVRIGAGPDVPKKVKGNGGDWCLKSQMCFSTSSDRSR